MMKRIFLPILVIWILLAMFLLITHAQQSRHFVFTTQGWQAPPKDPGATLDYTIDWTAWLNGDTLVTSTWSFTGPDTVLVIQSSNSTTTSSTVWLSAGTSGLTYRVTDKITTAAGRTTDQSFLLWVTPQ